MSERETPQAFLDAVFAQAENLESAASAARAALAEADLAPLRSGVVILTGMGASWHALAPAVHALRAAGRRAFGVFPTELADVRVTELADSFVVVSQSGASAEVLAVLERLEGAFVVAVSAAEGGALSDRADVRLPLGPLPDTPVATLSYTATLQTLGMLCDELVGDGPDPDWDAVPELVMHTLRDSEGEAQAAPVRLGGIRALDAIGRGVSVASAGETALLAREGLRIPAAGYETRQYLHGPLESAAPGLGCVLFGSERELILADSLRSYGAAVAVVTDRRGADSGEASVFQVPEARELVAPILEILPAQLMAGNLAAARGLSIGRLERQQADTKVA